MRSLAILAPAALLLAGCTGLLPAHPLSLDTEGERVTITMLDQTALAKKADQLGFTLPTEEQSAAGPLAVVAGFAIDSVKSWLDEQAQLYEAQFEVKSAFDDFWVGDKPQYVGLCVERSTARDPAKPAFTLVCTMAPTKDSQLLTIQPVYLAVQRAKAKVLYFDASKWWSAPWIWYFDTGDKVDVDVNLEIGAAWRDQSGTFNDTKIASASFSAAGLVLGTARREFEPKVIAGWMPGVPRSQDGKGAAKGSGNFWIHAVVTERDPSNAKKDIEKASHYLESNRDSLISHVAGDHASSSQNGGPAAAHGSSPAHQP